VEQQQQQNSSLQLQNPTDYRYSGGKKIKNLPSSSSSQHQKFQIPNFFKLCEKPNSQNPSSSSFEGSFFMGKNGNWSCAATKPKSVPSPPKKNSGIRRSFHSGGIVPISYLKILLSFPSSKKSHF
jgi:hypothetical protein